MQDIDRAYRLIADEMNSMEELARRTLANVDPFVEDVVRYGILYGGKRLRPAILFLAGRAVGDVTEKHIRTAAAVELIHTASLIHDDILDGAVIRRHLATLNVRWNSQIGVLAGDLLLTRAMELVLRDDDLYCFRGLTIASQKTCEGELRQIGTIGRFDMTQEEYFDMIAGKTAPLLACSAELGAHCSGADAETVERFRLFGHKLGLAFQVIDDILDLVGETNTAGKTLHTDLINRKPTLPLILYLRSANPLDRTEILDLLRRDDLDEAAALDVIDRLRHGGAIEDAREKAETLLRQAVETVQAVPGDADALAGLVSLARFIGNRKK